MGFFGGGGGATVANMVGATTSTAGTAGLVPAPAAGKNTRALFSDGTFGEIPMVPAYKNTTASYAILPLAAGGQGRSGTIKVRRFCLVFVPADGNIDTLAFGIRTSPTSNLNVHVAMWECSESGQPSTYLIGGTTTILTTQSFAKVSISVTSTAVKRGWYFMSITPAATFTTQTFEGVAVPGGVWERMFIGSNGNVDNAQTVFSYTCNTSYDQTTHETFGFATSAWHPLGFEYV